MMKSYLAALAALLACASFAVAQDIEVTVAGGSAGSTVGEINARS
jgi:hypothetical protein